MFKQTDAMKDDKQELTLFDNYDFIEKIESLMADCESAEVEFKSARGGFPGSLWETYSAFANTQGGVIVLGVKEKDGKFTLDGITLEQARKYKKEFWDNVNNKAHCSANVLQEKDVQDGEYNGSYVLVFNVPRAPGNMIPVYLHNNPENTFKRNYEGDYRCDASEIKRMFADADSTEHPRDYKILPEFTIEQDIDKATLEQYRRLVATKSPRSSVAAAGRQTFPDEIERLPDRSARKDRGTDTCRSADVRKNRQHHRRLRMSTILSRLP